MNELVKDLTKEEIYGIKDKQCKFCKYHGVVGDSSSIYVTCDYLIITKNRRNCSIKECERFEAGKRKRELY